MITGSVIDAEAKYLLECLSASGISRQGTADTRPGEVDTLDLRQAAFTTSELLKVLRMGIQLVEEMGPSVSIGTFNDHIR